MHELPWITIFGHECVCVCGWICQWFSRVTKSRVKIIGKSPHEWPKEIIIHGNECIIPFFTRYISWTHRSTTKNHRSLISPLSLATVFSDLTVTSSQLICDVTRTRGTGIVTSYSRLFLHAQIGTRRSSLVNNNREYLTNRYSRLSV